MILKKWFYKIVINYMFNITSRGQTFISADVNTPPNSPSKVHFIPLLSRLSKTKFLDLKWYIIGLSSFFSAREVIIVDRFAILVGFLISTTSNKPSCISFLNRFLMPATVLELEIIPNINLSSIIPLSYEIRRL